MGGPERVLDYTKLLLDAANASHKPHYLMNTRPGVMHRDQVNLLRAHGIAMIGGSRQGLGAIDKLARWLRLRPALRAPAAGGPSVATVLNACKRATINEFDAKRLLAEHGIPVVQEKLVDSDAEAKDAARSIGYPVVLKVVSDDIPHKSEHGLVIVDISDDAALAVACNRLQERLAKVPGKPSVSGVLVQQMVRDGVEVFAGINRDPDFGHALAFGIGGVAVDVMRDFALRLLPLRAGDAEAMIGEIKGAKLLNGIRGGPPADIASLARCLYALGDFAFADRAHIAEIDLNPIKVRPLGQGCIVVDALIVPIQAGTE
jgi:acyl-CoA synthetase (NDP forming)